MSDLRILVTGSRDWTDGNAILAALWAQVGPGRGKNVTIVHGAARGADDLAGQVARAHGWNVEEHPAPWRDMGKRAGIVRNGHMINLGADLCLAFIRNRSRGATHCADAAERAGIPTIRFEVSDE